MTSAAGPSLAKVTVSTPRRTIDVALPEDVTLAELLPFILRHAGDETADAGERHAGWILRRTTGQRLDSRKSLGAQKVLDGEILHLVPGHEDWPELEYEDLVEAIAAGARRYGRSWGKSATRACGLMACAAILLAGSLIATRFDPPWLLPGLVLLGVAVLLMAAGVVVERALPDGKAGVVLAGCSLPYAFLGGWMLTGADHLSITGFGASQLLLAATTLLVFGIIGYVGVTAVPRVFGAAIVVALLGMLGALLAGPLAADAAAAVVLTVGIGLLPGYPMLAIRLGRLPLPVLPQRSAELLSDEPLPPKPTIFTSAVRAEEILAGLMTGLAVVTVIGAVFLASHDGTARLIMLAVVAVALLLRARLFPIPRHRVPLLTAGAVVAAMLLWHFIAATPDNGGRARYLLLVIAIASLAAYAGLTYSKKNPSPYLGKGADVFDVVAILALVPFTGYITGFYGYVQGLMAGVG